MSNVDTALIRFEITPNDVFVGNLNVGLPIGTISALRNIKHDDKGRFFTPYPDKNVIATQTETGDIYLFSPSSIKAYEYIDIIKVSRLEKNLLDTARNNTVAFTSEDMRALHRIISTAIAGADTPLILDPGSENDVVNAYANRSPDLNKAILTCLAELPARWSGNPKQPSLS